MPRISPEKSGFAQTCNLLSHYLKQKGTLRDLNLGINGEAADTSFSGQASTQINVKPMNLFPQHATMQDDDAISITTSSSEQSESEPKNGQMTIFYEGQVMVFDNICAAKAEQVMQLASKSVTPIMSSSNTSRGNAESSASGCAGVKQQWQAIVSDLPIARRASLHRFLSKRKDRASGRGPYPSPKEQLFDLNL